MVLFPNCKINIGLNIIKKREDGFHELESLFYPLQLKDALEVIPSKAKQSSFSSSGIVIPEDGKKNLCIRAWEIVKKHHDIPSVKIHLYKNIPIGAGLGGGSADAAFTLTMLNQLFELGLPKSTLAKYAETLGSDCAFFVYNQTSLVSGRGEIIEPHPIDLSNYKIVLINPPIHVSTVKAYKKISPRPWDTSLQEVLQMPVEEWKTLLHNDFEKNVFKSFPEIAEIKKDLYSLGALYASMSGSGASVFGIFNKFMDIPLTKVFKNYFIFEENTKVENI